MLVEFWVVEYDYTDEKGDVLRSYLTDKEGDSIALYRTEESAEQRAYQMNQYFPECRYHSRRIELDESFIKGV